ncbi:MAG: type III pantothenate kinase [candidate division WOR-3 bacterium]
MVIALDIGNTNTRFGFYRKDRFEKIIQIPTRDGFKKNLPKEIFEKDIQGVAIASVVPELSRAYIKFFQKNFHLKPLVISGTIKSPVKFRYREIRNLGADRIANVTGGHLRFPRDLIIVSFGTATVCDVVLKEGNYLGGMIAPGIETGLWALELRTRLLKKIPLRITRKILGLSTEECLRSGILNGTKFMIQGFIREIKKEKRRDFLCISTGGLGQLMRRLIPEITYYVPDLTLQGVIKLYYYNV